MALSLIHISRIIRIGLPTGIQNMVISFSNVLVQSSVNSYGAAAMAGLDVYKRQPGGLARGAAAHRGQPLPRRACTGEPVSYTHLDVYKRQYLDKDEVLYSYSTDARDALGAPNALYNCVASFQRKLPLTADAPLAEVAVGVDADLKENLSLIHISLTSGSSFSPADPCGT